MGSLRNRFLDNFLSFKLDAFQIKINCDNYIPDENYNNFMAEGMEVDEVAVELGGIEILRENEYLVDRRSFSKRRR